jgi:glycyl-tRNA synthetase
MLPQKLPNFNRIEFEDTCKRNFLFDISFDLYSDIAGLYDYGPVLCTIKNNFIQEWKRHFIIEENMCEIECTCFTPEEVFINSGYVKRFNDIMFKNIIENDNNKVYYLRPELSQGIFMNFKRLMESQAKQIPFAIASIGQAFRKEIAPNNSLLQVKEFTLAEIVHFIDPNNKKHAQFDSIKGVSIFSWNREHQANGKEPTLDTINNLVAKKIIDNETLGYFIAKTQLFLQNIGIKYIRFRQHRIDEIANYAQDCWMAECLTSYGWVDCICLTDRSIYDLTQHSNETGKGLYVREDLETPIIVEKKKIIIDNKELVKKTFDKFTEQIINHIENMNVTDEILENFRNNSGEIKLQISDIQFVITKDMYDIITECEKQSSRNYIPNAIGTSFSINKILYSCLEQNFFVRKNENKEKKRTGFSILPNLAYRQVAIIASDKNQKFNNMIKRLCDECNYHNISFYQDDSSISISISIEEKYARMDEMGIPYCITCDFVDDFSVALRERDTTKQIRISFGDISNIVKDLCKGRILWSNLLKKYK